MCSVVKSMQYGGGTPSVGTQMCSINDLLTGYSVRTRKYEVRSCLYGPSLRGPCVKVRASYFQYGPSNPVSKLFINDIIIFQTKATFLQGLHIVWYVVLMFTNRLSGI